MRAGLNESGSYSISALRCEKSHLFIRIFFAQTCPLRYRFQYDGRLTRSLETAVMLMETFARLTRPDKYVWDVSDYSRLP